MRRRTTAPVGTGQNEWPAATWGDLRRAIQGLDKAGYSDVLIGPSADDLADQWYMAVSGGNDGRYVVCVQEGERGFFYLLGDPKARRRTGVYVGGAIDFYPGSRVVGVRQALNAARYYFETGERDRSLNWTRGSAGFKAPRSRP